MADKDEILDYDESEQPAAEKKKGPSPPALIVMILGVALVLFTLWPDSGSKQSVGVNPGDNQYDPKKASDSLEKDKLSQESADDVLELGEISEQGGLVALDVEVQGLKEELAKERAANRKLAEQTQTTLRKIENKFDDELKQLTALMTDISKGRVDNIQQSSRVTVDGSNDYPVLLDANGNPIDDESDPNKRQSNFSYRTFRVTTNNNDLLSEQAGIGGGNNLLPGNLSSDLNQAPGSQRNRNNDTQSNSSSQSTTDKKQDDKKSSLAEETIAALSKVRVTNLHGMNCPISNTSSNDGFGRVPVFIPIVGIFKGPNGQTYDIGNAHLLGYCEGIEVGSEVRARINVTELSYVDLDGKEHHIQNIKGYVMDLEDNTQDLQGIRRKARGRKLAKASAAAGVSAIANITAQSAFDTTRSTDNETVTSTLDSERVGRAAAGAGFGTAADLIAQEWLREANRSFDVVYVHSGKVFDFYSIVPFIVMAPPSDEDKHYANAEPLL